MLSLYDTLAKTEMIILLATLTPNCFNLSLQSNYKAVGLLVERSHAEFNATMWYDGTTEKKTRWPRL